MTDQAPSKSGSGTVLFQSSIIDFMSPGANISKISSKNSSNVSKKQSTCLQVKKSTMCSNCYNSNFVVDCYHCKNCKNANCFENNKYVVNHEFDIDANQSYINDNLIASPIRDEAMAPPSRPNNVLTVPINICGTVAPSVQPNNIFTGPINRWDTAASEAPSAQPQTKQGQNSLTPQNSNEPPAIVNLSSLKLTPSMKSVLSKGLQFCPTPGESDTNELYKDLNKFHVGLRRKQFSANL
jgi:hypothetical protein